MRRVQWFLVAALSGAFCPALQAGIKLEGRVLAATNIVAGCDQAVNGVYHVRRAAKPPVIDGKPNEWKDVPAMVLDRKEQSKGKWDGPQDLSGSMRLMWDEQALYFCLEAKDDVHSAPNTEKDFWANDGCQLAFDAYMNGPEGGYDQDEISLCVCDSPKGPLMAHYRLPEIGLDAEGTMPEQFAAMAVQTDGTRVYEWAIPWKRLEPVSPWVLGRSGFSFTLNDNDGEGFKTGMQWTKGIFLPADASQFGQIVFDGAVGARTGMVSLVPESAARGLTPQTSDQSIQSLLPSRMARVFVSAGRAGRIEAEVAIYRKGEKVPMATGRLDAQAGTNQIIAFAWDTAPLGNGEYEVAYKVPAVCAQPTPRTPFVCVTLDELRKAFAGLQDNFELDRPWYDMAGAPAVVRRHRGLAAVARELLDDGYWAQTVRSLNMTEYLRTLDYATAMLKEVAAGKDFLGGKRGDFWSAYYSPADGSGQPFVTRVPGDYDPAKSWPLIVRIHGRGGRPLPSDGSWKLKCLAVEPWGRGDQGYRLLAEDDVLRIIAYMREWYNVDADRVYITGASMGGGGTWWMASRHPDLFAAGSVLCGYSSDIPFDNLRNIPMYVQHGMIDSSIAIDQARQAVDALRQLGYAVTYREYYGVGHSVPDEINALEKMLDLKRSARPDAVSYTCETSDVGQAYWLSIRRLTDPHCRASVDARVAGPASYRVLSVRASNIDALELDTQRMPLDHTAALHIQIESKEFVQISPIPERLFLVRNADGWAVTNQWAPPPVNAREYRPGGAANLYTGEPLLIVYGTGGANQRTEMLRAAATNLVRFGGRARDPLTPGRFPVKADRDVTPDDLQRFNLVLLGGPKDNRLVARMADKFPFQINDRGELIAGGREPVSLKGAAVRFHYYNPLAPLRLVYIVWTDEDSKAAKTWWTHAGEFMQVTGGMNLIEQPDLVVQSLRSLDAAALTNTDSRVNGPYRRLMQFTYEWKWRELPGVDVRLPSELAKSRTVAQIDLRLLRRYTAADVAIGWNPAEDDVEYDPQWITRADVATRCRTSHQTLLCTVSGKDLIDLYLGRVAKGEFIMDSALPPLKMDPAKEYRVVIPVELTGDLWKIEGKLHNIQAGSDWDPAICWQEVFEAVPRVGESPGSAK